MESNSIFSVIQGYCDEPRVSGWKGPQKVLTHASDYQDGEAVPESRGDLSWVLL